MEQFFKSYTLLLKRDVNFSSETFLKGDIIDGILLLTFNGKHAYSHGELSHVIEDDYTQFVGIFDLGDEHKETHFYQDGFNLRMKNEKDEKEHKFIIRRKTFHSVYATSKRNVFGLVVVNLPFGVLVASHHHPITSAVACEFVENAAELLRM
ncbi:uncharacterized protein LOC135689830 isoform X2 [Rhopilema esculentum]|uniref:uncharacterized protein LOC135689830 isoform X2 n=1 Tax=Rhopilema esculentum TaxID=499914 RepID=UPI0031DABDF9